MAQRTCIQAINIKKKQSTKRATLLYRVGRAPIIILTYIVIPAGEFSANSEVFSTSGGNKVKN